MAPDVPSATLRESVPVPVNDGGRLDVPLSPLAVPRPTTSAPIPTMPSVPMPVREPAVVGDVVVGEGVLVGADVPEDSSVVSSMMPASRP